MFQVAASILFAFTALASMAAIATMLRTNQTAILSALSGHGAFPESPTPEKDPASKAQQMIYVTRTTRRVEHRNRQTARRQFSRAA